MANQRNDFRLVYSPLEAFPVALRHVNGAVFPGKILNLSVGGMAVQLGSESVALELADWLLVQFALPAASGALIVPSAVVHRRTTPRNSCYGLEFLPVAEAAATESRERLLWQYLLREQRRFCRVSEERDRL